MTRELHLTHQVQLFQIYSALETHPLMQNRFIAALMCVAGVADRKSRLKDDMQTVKVVRAAFKPMVMPATKRYAEYIFSITDWPLFLPPHVTALPAAYPEV